MVDINTDELKQAAPLIPYIKNFYPEKLPIMRQAGSTVFTKCPWHEEKTASLAFFDNGSYKCFGCGEHGDVITLVQKLENMSFQEACKHIGQNVGYEVIIEPPNPEHEKYKDYMNQLNKQYWANLQQDGDALRYLLFERGISKEMIDLFRLGYTPPDEYTRRKDTGNISNKIVFPILDHTIRNPRCVGMAYRVMDDSKPKYVNDTNHNDVFIKGNMLFGYPQAYQSIKDQGYAILVEGYFDVISLKQSNIGNAVAVMGSSITEAQAKVISRITKNVMLLMDGDGPGKTAIFRNLPILYRAGLTVAVCMLEGGMDPDNLCRKYDYDGAKISREMQACTEQSIEVILDKATKKYQNVASLERKRAIELAMPVINAIQDDTVRELYTRTLYKRLDM